MTDAPIFRTCEQIDSTGDIQFYERTITGVENQGPGYIIDTGDGSYAGCMDHEFPIVPEVGMVARFYGMPHGSVRGLAVDGQVVYYKSPEKIEAERLIVLKEFEEEDATRKAEYASLVDLASATEMPSDARDAIARWKNNIPTHVTIVGGGGIEHDRVFWEIVFTMLECLLDTPPEPSWEAVRTDRALYAEYFDHIENTEKVKSVIDSISPSDAVLYATRRVSTIIALSGYREVMERVDPNRVILMSPK